MISNERNRIKLGIGKPNVGLKYSWRSKFRQKNRWLDYWNFKAKKQFTIKTFRQKTRKQLTIEISRQRNSWLSALQGRKIVEVRNFKSEKTVDNRNFKAGKRLIIWQFSRPKNRGYCNFKANKTVDYRRCLRQKNSCLPKFQGEWMKFELLDEKRNQTGNSKPKNMKIYFHGKHMRMRILLRICVSIIGLCLHWIKDAFQEISRLKNYVKCNFHVKNMRMRTWCNRFSAIFQLRFSYSS